jgi:hypothetical protein
LDLSKNPSVNDVFKRALYIYDYEGYGNNMDYSEDDAIDQYVAQKFGQDVLDQLTHARNQSYFGRADGKGPGGSGRTSNLGTSSAPGGKFRTTRAGVMNKQDAKIMKGRIANRLGRHPAPNLPEGMLDNPGQPDSPVAQAIIRRILMQRTDLLAKYGPVYVGQAVDDVADFVGDVDEIGSSDVSGWIKQVERNLKDKINQYDRPMDEAKYQGREVALGKPTRGDVKKFKVYVRDPSTGNIKKVNFGHGGTSAKRAGQKTMKIKKSDPARRRSFRARHNCDNPGSRLKARYWSCRAW